MRKRRRRTCAADIVGSAITSGTLRRHHDVALAKSGDEALALIAGDDSFDAIISDLMMPGMTGMRLHAEVTQRFPRLATKMIFMSGGAFTEEARDFATKLGELCLEKPFEIAVLRERLRALG